MAEVDSWRDELSSFLDGSGVRYTGDPMESSTTSFQMRRSEYVASESLTVESEGSGESFKDQAMGFVMAWCEILMELGRGCRDIVQQNLMNENSYVVKKLGGPCAKASKRLRFLNDFLPEDRDPLQAWSVVFFVFILALAAISVDPNRDTVAPAAKVRIHPPSASRIQLPDGRYMAYDEQGVPAAKARFSLIAPQSFLSSRLTGLPGVKASLLEEYGVRLVTYDLPGFGESDPHPKRNLNSSAMDLLHLANAVNVSDKFWVLCHSSGCIHAWASLRYIPERIAGAAMLAPMINPFDPRMTKDEMKRTWEKWLPRRKFMFSLARRIPKFLSYFYRKSFLSGKHDKIDRQLSFSLGKKDEILIEEPAFEEFWQRNVEESVRLRSTQPFIEEAVLQVSNWGFDLAELHVQRKCQTRGILLWLKSMYSQAECELAGFLGLINIWQGLDDRVVPPSMAEYIGRVLPEAIIHRLPNEGHLSYFFFCDECHRQIFSTLFGSPQGPVVEREEETETAIEEDLTVSASDTE
ncbi:Alpha/Beta hydrolase fold [Senna tora]|uniref:Alpha/Beta hydrolase fold n=1 Tax=Senna tora TaxID=362788 RepID=A0A834WCR5_9FABA|nr:Alpha/Beta hydrolase fold [Senna tora]